MVLTLVKRGGIWQGLELDNEVEEATIMKHIGGADLVFVIYRKADLLLHISAF